MLPAQHARSTPQQAGSAPGFRATEVHSTGAQQGPSASAQHLGPRAAGHAGHTHTKQCARPAAGRRANECARTRPSCSASLPPLSAARGRGVGEREGTRAMPIAKDTPPEGRGSREIRVKRAADTTASSAMAAGATDTTVVGTTATDSQGMAMRRRSRGGGSGRRLSLPLRGTGAQSATGQAHEG